MSATSELTSARAIVRGAEEGEALWFRENRMTIKARGSDTGGAYGLVESWVRAGSGPPWHVHHREEEAFWVISGQLTFRCGDEEFSAGPGAFALLPRDVPHAFWVEGDEPAHLLTLLSPGGGEEFFVLGGRPAEGPGLPPASPPEIEPLMRAAAQTGVEILGPPIGPSQRSG